MILRHYSNKPLEKPIYSCEQHEKPYDKPRGFWVSVVGEYDWPSWCNAESYRIDYLRVPHNITLRPDAKILRLSSAVDLDTFTEQFSVNTLPDFRHGYRQIDWRKVAKDHQGIIIAPYIWERRLNGAASNWYYTWDCASGCIWDADAIEAVTVSALEEAAWRPGETWDATLSMSPERAKETTK